MSKHQSGQGGPAGSAPRSHQHQAAALDRELLELQKRKLVALSNGTVRLTRAGYLELYKRFPRRS